MSIHKKRVLVIGCVICSLLIHLLLLKMRVYQHYFVVPWTSSSIDQLDQHLAPHEPLRPIMLARQVPRNVKRAYQRLKALPAPIQLPPEHRAPVALVPQPPPPPVAPEQAPAQKAPEIPAGHKIFRAGTGLDAPMTDHALALTPPAQAVHAPAQQAAARAEPAPEPLNQFGDNQTTQNFGQADKTRTHADTQQAPAARPTLPTSHVKSQTHVPALPSSRRLAIIKFDPTRTNEPESAINPPNPVETPVQENNGEPATVSSGEVRYHPYQTQQHAGQKSSKALEFLAAANFEQLIREHLDEESTENNENQSNNGSSWHGSQVQRQYGELRFLHYNRKLYQALQQSMDLVASTLSHAQYRAAMDGIHSPTRINFALDQNGHIVELSVGHSSGNLRYDNIAIKIVKEASFPSIPKSFELRKTYHHYNILLFDPGDQARGTIGVSPYLEGE